MSVLNINNCFLKYMGISNIGMTVAVDEDKIWDNINILPDELLICIFKFLPLDSLLNCENVCKRWKKLARDPSLWRRIILVYSGKPGQSEVSKKNLEIISSHRECIFCIKIQYEYNYTFIKNIIEQCKNLISLELVMCRVANEFEHDILKWPHLKKNSLKSTILLSSNTNLLIHFDQFKDLRYLVLSDFGLSAVNCNALLQCHHLSSIYIEKIKDLELAFIQDLILCIQKTIETFHIYGGNSIDNNCIKLLSKCPSLKDFAIIRCENLTDEGLLSLTELKNLQFVQIWNNNIFSENALLHTMGTTTFVSLKSLSLSRIENITSAIVDLISEHYKNLKFLALYQCPKIINIDYEKQLKSKFRNIEVVLY